MFSYVTFLLYPRGVGKYQMQSHECHFGHRTIVVSTHLLLILKPFLIRGEEHGLWFQIAWVTKGTLTFTGFWIFRLGYLT